MFRSKEIGVESSPLKETKTMHLLFSPELANVYYIGGGGLGLLLLIVIIVLVLR
jgi:hypothetical protein